VDKLFTISQVAKLLKLTDKSTLKPKNYILRYWEREFKQIKPKLINKRRYYTSKQIEILKYIAYMIKNKGMSIRGVKNLLNSKINQLDDRVLDSLKKDYNKSVLKEKTSKILEKIKRIKRYGKKNSH
tara:strand:+ start:868 stop:1248 length:381 start_codon:yes stop_codon:yes gene_type:complete